ncbi:uncharacterized protein BDV17DRAFT_248832 [Aspergillus undulatus]|uniref:uncharacterized protein n=1 Tax=Aspergillus undulatus TaxID=1810928 RepID=UPI003CCD2CDE
MSCAIGYSAGIQALIYQSPPCYNHPLSGPCSNDGRAPNDNRTYTLLSTRALTVRTSITSFLCPGCSYENFKHWLPRHQYPNPIG